MQDRDTDSPGAACGFGRGRVGIRQGMGWGTRDTWPCAMRAPACGFPTGGCGLRISLRALAPGDPPGGDPPGLDADAPGHSSRQPHSRVLRCDDMQGPHAHAWPTRPGSAFSELHRSANGGSWRKPGHAGGSSWRRKLEDARVLKLNQLPLPSSAYASLLHTFRDKPHPCCNVLVHFIFAPVKLCALDASDLAENRSAHLSC
jgi:hypothetical protein